MIGGEVTRAGLRLALLLFVLSVVTLVFQDRSSAGFVVTVMALAVSIIFVVAVLLVTRLGAAQLPSRSDNQRDKGYNTRRSIQERGRDES